MFGPGRVDDTSPVYDKGFQHRGGGSFGNAMAALRLEGSVDDYAYNVATDAESTMTVATSRGM